MPTKQIEPISPLLQRINQRRFEQKNTQKETKSLIDFNENFKSTKKSSLENVKKEQNVTYSVTNSRIFDDNISTYSKNSRVTNKSAKKQFLRAVSVNNPDHLYTLY